MPAIHLLGRRTLLGGDDLQLPCFLAISLRVIQLLGCLVPIWWNIGVEAKRHGGSGTIYGTMQMISNVEPHT
jgi:hypothetical protein